MSWVNSGVWFCLRRHQAASADPVLTPAAVPDPLPFLTVSSGSVTVNADSTVQVLAEEAVTMDMLDLATAKSNLEKAVSEMAAASDEAARAEAQIKVEANEALVKALE